LKKIFGTPKQCKTKTSRGAQVVDMQEFKVAPGMASSVFHNKYSRKKEDGTYQTWGERITEVVDGNFSLDPRTEDHSEERNLDYNRTLDLSRQGVMVYAGRHLQHGDQGQKSKNGEKWTNCSTAMFSFVQFWLLMQGSGVGRDYSSDLVRVNLDHMPNVRFVLQGPDVITGAGGHPNYEPWIESAQEARHKYDSESEMVRWFTVDDSVEGWVQVVEILETAAWQEKHADKLFIFDFSNIRPKGAPIRGQQNRPASGPIPFIHAMVQVASLKGAGMKPWQQAMHMDHYLAACVAVGDVRRSARIAAKSWRDRDVLEFVDIKRGGWLYTANNSVLVDDEFWDAASSPKPSHARRVFEAVTSAAYFDQTGDPGFLNQARMCWNPEGLDTITEDTIISSTIRQKMDFHPKTMEMVAAALKVAKKKSKPFLTNPCSEIVLANYGGYCIIGNVCMMNATSDADLEDACKLMAQALIRVNTMQFMYESEVKRTNRIGVGLTGIFEFAFQRYGFNFYDLINTEKSKSFWDFIRHLRDITVQEASRFSLDIGVNTPHTVTTIMPNGTIGKVMGCTEGAHLPAYGYYCRWVMYSKSSEALEDFRQRGYPIKDVSHQYAGHVVVGFPTKLDIADLMGDQLVTADQVTPEEQFKWIELVEENWLGVQTNNNISYTLKYDPKKVGYQEFMAVVLEHQRKVRTCSVMPQIDLSAYAYQPEEPLTKEGYDLLVGGIQQADREDYDENALACSGGACPIEQNIN